jgi:hypothetical protein
MENHEFYGGMIENNGKTPAVAPLLVHKNVLGKIPVAGSISTQLDRNI